MPCQQLSSHGAGEIIKVEDPDDAETLSEKESQCQLTNGDHDSPVRVGLARTNRRGRRRMSASRVKGKEKQGFECTRLLVRSGRPHIACFAAERGRALRAAYFFASLDLLAAARTSMTLKALSRPTALPR